MYDSPIIITGMHRSGTSMVSQILYRCGLNLGEMDDLAPADGVTNDNPDGYWEKVSLVKLMDRILLRLNSNWSSPAPILENKNWPKEVKLIYECGEILRCLTP